MRQGGGGDLAAVVALHAAGQGPEQGAPAGGGDAQTGQHAGDLGLGCGLDQAGQDHPRERRIAFNGGVEPQALISAREDLPQQRRAPMPCHRPGRASRDPEGIEIQHALTRGLRDPAAPDLHQRRQLGLVVGRAQVLHDPAHPALPGHDLYRRGPRRGADLTQIRAHTPDPTGPLVPHRPHPTPTIPTKNPQNDTKSP